MATMLKKYATATVPRYTSYPSVPHFRAGFPAATYRDWLGALDPARPISLYLHVPFCRELCWYCGCNMKLASRYEPVAAYIKTLIKELDLVADALPGRLTVSHLHFGGGTPTALEPGDLARVMEKIRERFDVTADAELAIESDPRTLNEAMIERLGHLGFNRASFGIQEFDPKVQAAINRIQPFEMVARAVECLHGAGIVGINFDLIYGLPHQTTGALTRTIAACLTLKPERIALFGYAHVPWMAKKQRLIDEAALPGPEERTTQAAAAARTIIAAGYQAIGLDHFALPDDALARAARNGTLHRNFQGYTSDQAETLIGLGATSIGRTPRGYIQNIAEPGAWARAVGEDLLPIAKGHALTRDDRLRAHVIERLMCDGAVDLKAAGRLFGAPKDWWADARPKLEEMQGDGLLVLDDAHLLMTEEGGPLVRVAAAAFDLYRRHTETRHSVAI
ncbi:MAG: oxygen-independent coproporphyrinogen III oxidase [Actinomycetota bacterium]